MFMKNRKLRYMRIVWKTILFIRVRKLRLPNYTVTTSKKYSVIFYYNFSAFYTSIDPRNARKSHWSFYENPARVVRTEIQT